MIGQFPLSFMVKAPGEGEPADSLWNDLAYYFTFEESIDGNFWSQVPVSSLALSDNGPVTLVPSASVELGNCAEFEQAIGTMLLQGNPDAEEFKLTGDTTIKFFVRLLDKAASYSLVSKDAGTLGDDRAFDIIYDQPADRFRLFVFGAATFASVTADNLGSPAVDTWYQISVKIVSGVSISIAANNGIPNSQAIAFTPLEEGFAEFRVGARAIGAGNEQYLNGAIDALYKYNRITTEDEDSRLWNDGDGLQI